MSTDRHKGRHPEPRIRGREQKDQGYRYLYPRQRDPAEPAGNRTREGGEDQRDQPARAPRHSVPRRRNR